jgi:hypothetical protein
MRNFAENRSKPVRIGQSQHFGDSVSIPISAGDPVFQPRTAFLVLTAGHSKPAHCWDLFLPQRRFKPPPCCGLLGTNSRFSAIHGEQIRDRLGIWQEKSSF